ncbi:MAG: M48 family metallopeptidase [Elusimicrobia bacterium]|jgi:predicted metal-dependent hydrolase|nr:M48 family metallopeptidase [Elusimicrobiota bacterium]
MKNRVRKKQYSRIKIKDRVIPYRLSRRDVKYARFEFKTGNLVVIVPRRLKNVKKIIKDHKNWIYKNFTRIQKALNEDSLRKVNFERSREELKQIASEKAVKYSNEMAVSVNKIFIRKMATRWGSLSSKRNITLNSIVKFLPVNLIEYIIYHEVVHLKERKHGKAFKSLIENRYNDYKKYDDELFNYWFILQKVSSDSPCPGLSPGLLPE